MLFRFTVLFCLLLLVSCSETPEVPEPDSTPARVFRPADTKDWVVYEVNLRAFSQGGDIQGVIDRLDNIKALGVNVIWLMPIHPIGTIRSVNSPYSVQDYKAVSSEFGLMEDMQRLIAEAHEREMGIMLDWVANHTAWDHAWVTTHPDWYTQDGSGNIIHPAGTNWQDVADLNFGNAEMRLAMIDALRFWVDSMEVDGFRCDAADFVPFDFWQQAWDSLQTGREKNLMLLAEGARQDHFDAGFDLNFAWNFYGRLKQVYDVQWAANLFPVHQSEYQNVPEGKHKLRFTTNHDESAWDATPMQLFGGKEGALSASVATIFMGGVPLIYGGQEVGRVQNIPFFSNSPIDWTENPDMRQAYEEILAVYTQSEAAKQGTSSDYSDAKICSFVRAYEGEELLVMTNVRADAYTYALPTELQNTTWQDVLTGEEIVLESELAFAGFGYWILEK